MSTPLGRLIEVNPPTPEFDRLSPDAQVTFVPLEAVWPDGLADFSRRAKKSSVASGYTRLDDGDILLPKITPTFEAGRVALAQIDTTAAAATTEVHILRAKPGVDARFISYVCRSAPFLQDGATRLQGVGNLRRVPADFIRQHPVEVVDLDEQQAIANFLNEQTSRIDALIAKQTRLIDTLHERQSAIIAHAINGNAKEAPLGQGAASRPAIQLRRITQFITSGSRGWADHYSETGDRFLRIGNMSRGSLALRGEVQHVELPASSTEGERTRLERGDLLFSITAYLGSVALVDERWSGGYVSQHVALCRIDKAKAQPKFVGYAMLAPDGQKQLKEGAAGGTKEQLTLGDLRELLLPMPPLERQNEIVILLDEQTSAIDRLIAMAKNHITLAKERRSALITAAVTGAIDVRTSGNAARMVS